MTTLPEHDRRSASSGFRNSEQSHQLDPFYDPATWKPDPELTWKMVAEMMAAERHFNSMQSNTRTMASTWLLGAFAGMGFLLINSDKLPKSNSLNTAGIAAITVASVATVAAIGIVLLWILDVQVWHRLLVANYDADLEFQTRHDWLPQVHKNFKQGELLRVRVYISLFYGIGVLVLFLLAAGGLAWQQLPWGGAILATVGVVSAALMCYSAVRSATKSDKAKATGEGAAR